MADKIVKFLKTLPPELREKIKQQLIKLQENPFESGDTKKLEGHKNIFRLRFGKLRIIFEVKNKQVIILDVDWRGNIY